MEYRKDIGSAVKGKLDHLKDSPDDLVWSNIEAHLKRKKKRRGFIFWLFGIFLVILFSSILVINTPELIEEQNNTNIKKNNTNKSVPAIDKPYVNLDYDSLQNNLPTTKSIEKISSIRSKIDNKTSKNNYSSKDKLNSLNKDKMNSLSENKVNKSNSNLNNKNITEIIDPNRPLNKENSSNQIAKKTNKDTLNLADKINKKPLEEKVNDSVATTNSYRWSITPHLIGSHYGALNAKTSNSFTLNYGVFASYRMTNSTYLRFGVRKLDLQQTIDSTANKVKYLEFPLEIKYAPFHKKFNPYFTGGLSYLVLQDSNSNNLNNFDYTATMSLNIGLGIETKLFKNFFLNFEPNFNYQLKPFVKSNEIKPYIFSIQTGLEYRF